MWTCSEVFLFGLQNSEACSLPSITAKIKRRQKNLLLLNAHLNDAFQGLEEGRFEFNLGYSGTGLGTWKWHLTHLAEGKCKEAVRLLVAPGKDLPPPLGAQILSGEASDNSTRRSEQSLMSSVSMLMLCCCTMLTSSYPVQVELTPEETLLKNRNVNLLCLLSKKGM